MFHLIVNGSGWNDDQDTFPRSRIFEHTEEYLVHLFKPNDELDVDRIVKYPAVFAPEWTSDGDNLARLGRIRQVRNRGGDAIVEFSYDNSFPPIPLSVLGELSMQLHIHEWEFTRTHWAIKDVDFFAAYLKRQLALGPTPKVFSLNFSAAVDNIVSVMMPFDDRFDPVIDALRGVVESVDYQCLRADDIWIEDAIIQDIVSLIQRSRIVICDCTGRNPNVFYEAGIAHTLGKDVILITQSEHDIPFDLRHLRYVEYLNNGEGLRDMSEKVLRRIRTLLES